MTTGQIAPRLAALALIATALVGCARDEAVPVDAEDADPAATRYEIAIDDAFQYEPEVLTVPAGTTIEVINRASRAHSVTADETAKASFDTGLIAEGDTGQFQLAEPGRYSYHCSLHPKIMHGVVVVE